MNANQYFWMTTALINAFTLGLGAAALLRPGAVKRSNVVWFFITVALLNASVLKVVNS